MGRVGPSGKAVGKGAQRCLCDRKDEGPSSRMVASEAAVEVLATFPAVLVSAEGSRAPLDFSLRGTLVGELIYFLIIDYETFLCVWRSIPPRWLPEETHE